MNMDFKSRSSTRPPSFFSTHLSPKNQVQVPYFNTQIADDPIYFMAAEVKKKITKTPRKAPNDIIKGNLSVVSKYQKESQLHNQSTQLPQRRTFYTSKSLHPTNNTRLLNLSNTIQNQRKLLSKITIHRIRSQREQLENQTKRIENSYNYISHKLQKDKRRSVEIQMKKIRNWQIHQKSKLLREELEYEKGLLEEETSLEKSRLRQAVLKQKKNKEKSVVNFYNNLHKNASQVRLLSQQIDEQILKTELSEIQAKKTRYLTQKQKQRRRLLNRQKSFQNKRLMAQTQFKQRWLNEFNQTTKARKSYLSKKQVLSQKMQKLYEDFKRQEQNEEGEQIYGLKSRQRTPNNRTENWVNPEQYFRR